MSNIDIEVKARMSAFLADYKAYDAKQKELIKDLQFEIGQCKSEIEELKYDIKQKDELLAQLQLLDEFRKQEGSEARKIISMKMQIKALETKNRRLNVNAEQYLAQLSKHYQRGEESIEDLLNAQYRGGILDERKRIIAWLRENAETFAEGRFDTKALIDCIEKSTRQTLAGGVCNAPCLP